MKKTKAIYLVIVLAVSALLLSAWSVFPMQRTLPKTKPVKEKGPALLQLENAAGKKIEDVKVPEVPKPTPVSSFEVNKSSTSYEVNKSTASSQGKTGK